MTVPPHATAAVPVTRPAPFDSRDLSGRIYQVLQQDIIQGQLPPGARLSLDDLARRFGVSVSPIRDALRLLAADGLVELRSRRGAFVTQPSRTDIQEVFQFRAIIECAAVEPAIAAGPAVLNVLVAHLEAMPATMAGETHADYISYIRHDEAFHGALVDALGNARLSETYAGLASFTLIARMLHRATSHRATQTLAEHRAILTALTTGDAPTARAAICAHLDHACAHLLQRLDALADEVEREPSEATAGLVGAADGSGAPGTAG